MSCVKINFASVLAVLFSCVFAEQSANICNIHICSCFERKYNRFVIDCKGDVKANTIDFEIIQWPENTKNLSVELYARNLDMGVAARFPMNPQVTILDLSGNSIKSILPNAFSKLPSLNKLILSHNELSYLSPDMLQGLGSLEHLDLSFNKLTSINYKVFEALKLKELNLSGNVINKIPDEIIDSLPDLYHLDLSRNGIFFVTFPAEYRSNITSLDLSRNNLTVLTGNTFEGVKQLNVLNLSNNKIGNIDSSTFTILTELKVLHLDGNALNKKVLLPDSVTYFDVSRNKFNQWPLENTPSGITDLILSENELEMVEMENDYDNLQTLIISHNRLSEFPQLYLPNLLKLDLGYNSLTQMPISIDEEQLPNLRSLVIDGNPISNLTFLRPIKLDKLDANNMPYLTRLQYLPNISGRNVTATSGGPKPSCIAISITNCPKLSEVDEDAFQNMKLCKLDLRNNAISYISGKLFDWRDSPVEGIDLQGNPLDCTCDLQWMLDSLLPRLYTKFPNLLLELRCESPEHHRGQRLVHWYNWKGAALCNTDGNSEDLTSNFEVLAASENNVGLHMGSSTGFFVIVACSMAVMIGLVVAGLHLVKQQREMTLRRNRRLIK